MAMGFMLVLLVISKLVYGDLPVHCLQDDIGGKWNFEISLSQGNDTSCGYSLPDSYKDHFDQEFESTEDSVELTLNDDNTISESTGSWTMVYDEGFEVRTEDKVYFAFSAYTPRIGTDTDRDLDIKFYDSHCGATLVGWWRSNDDLANPSAHGCFKATRTVDPAALQEQEYTSDSLSDTFSDVDAADDTVDVAAEAGDDSVNSEEDTLKQMESLLETYKADKSTMSKDQLLSIKNTLLTLQSKANPAGATWKRTTSLSDQLASMIQDQSDDHEETDTSNQVLLQINAANSRTNRKMSSLARDEQDKDDDAQSVIDAAKASLVTPKITVESVVDTEGFASVDGRKMEMARRLYQPNYDFINHVNSDSSRTWSAKAHAKFEGSTHAEMDLMRGVLSSGKSLLQLSQAQSQAASQKTLVNNSADTADNSDDLTLPAAMDWRNHNGLNYDSPVVDQASCGSCYVMSSIGSTEARYRIALADATANESLSQEDLHSSGVGFLSSQDTMQCSYYNQGCAGGYPFLVGKQGVESGFAGISVAEYTASDEGCPTETDKGERVFLKSYDYVGGGYGRCTEEAMMRDIYTYGPLVAAFTSPKSLFYYDSGVFQGPSPDSEWEEESGYKWEGVNHAIIIVGWGEEEQASGDVLPYWIVKNSWGSEWGEDGYFRMLRGSDECAIESMGVSLLVKI